MKKFIGILLLVVFMSNSQFSFGEDYRVNITRKDSNLYEVTGQNIFIMTRFCFEFVYYEDAILKMNGYAGSLVFLSSGEKYSVECVYGSTEIDPGTYEVTISHVSDDWYEVFGKDLYIKTSMCLSLALGEKAFLKIDKSGFGTLYIDGDECMVEGVYSRLRL